MDAMIAHRDLSNVLFPFCSCVKRKLLLIATILYAKK